MVIMAGRDAQPVFPVGQFYMKDCSLYGFAMFNASLREQRHAANAINRWVTEGKLKARIDRVLPLAQTAEAHRLQEESTIHKARHAGRQDRAQTVSQALKACSAGSSCESAPARCQRGTLLRRRCRRRS